MHKTLIKILLIIGVLFAGYSYFIEPNKLEVTNYTIQDKELSGVKIVFASDFHIKPYGQKRLEKIVETISMLNICEQQMMDKSAVLASVYERFFN